MHWLSDSFRLTDYLLRPTIFETILANQTIFELKVSIGKREPPISYLRFLYKKLVLRSSLTLAVSERYFF